MIERGAGLARGLAEQAAAWLAGLAGRRFFGAAHFDRVYTAADPWAYASSAYEAARREALLAALPRPRYRLALEVGCGEGHTTRLLAGRADRVVGLDISPLALARARLAGLPPNVELVRGDLLGERLPAEAPPGAFDLVVCAELLYYCYWLPFGRACRTARDRLVGWLAPGGDLVLQHPGHYPTHRPFDRLARDRSGGWREGPLRGEEDGPAGLIPIARRRLPLRLRPVAVAVYRRPANGSCVVSPRAAPVTEPAGLAGARSGRRAPGAPGAGSALVAGPGGGGCATGSETRMRRGRC